MRLSLDARYLSHGLVGGVHTYVAHLLPALFEQAALLIEFKILPKGVFGDADQFRNLGMGQPMGFQP